MNRTSVAAVSVVIVSLLILGGCTDPGPEPSSPPVSPSISTPPPTPPPSPSASGPTESDVQNARRSIVEARRILDQVVMKGSDYKIPEQIFDYVDEDGSWYAQQRENVVEASVLELTVSGPATVTAESVDADGFAKRIEFYVCVDGSNTTVNFPVTGPSPGSISEGRLYVEQRAGRWLVTDYPEGYEFQEVDQCDEPR